MPTFCERHALAEAVRHFVKAAFPELTFLTVFNIHSPAYRALSLAIPAHPGRKGNVGEFK
jgi:hypothetical protein